jgi:hypothetical protein
MYEGNKVFLIDKILWEILYSQIAVCQHHDDF